MYVHTITLDSPHDFSLGTETIQIFSFLFEIMIASSVSFRLIR